MTLRELEEYLTKNNPEVTRFKRFNLGNGEAVILVETRKASER